VLDPSVRLELTVGATHPDAQVRVVSVAGQKDGPGQRPGKTSRARDLTPRALDRQRHDPGVRRVRGLEGLVPKDGVFQLRCEGMDGAEGEGAEGRASQEDPGGGFEKDDPFLATERLETARLTQKGHAS
jgi:hypothetical protein